MLNVVKSGISGKKIVVCFAVLVASISNLNAQQKASEKVVIKSANAVCEACKEFLEARLKHEEGITDVNVNYQRKTITVTYLTDRTSLNTVRLAISDWGFDADDVLADANSYNRVPPCCKRPVVTVKPAADSLKSKADTAKLKPVLPAAPVKKG